MNFFASPNHLKASDNDLTILFNSDDPYIKDTSSWKFIVPNEIIGIHVAVPLNSESFKNYCTLPHSIDIPNQEIWYLKEMSIMDTVFLFVNADDGAQVWQNNRKVNSLNGRFYQLWPKNGYSNIVIRVLNNAVSGGLRASKLLKPEELTDILKREHTADSVLVNKWTGSLKQSLSINPYHEIQLKDTSLVSFTFWGDSQGGWDTFNRVMHFIAEENADFTIGLGDLTSNGSLSGQWLDLINTLEILPSHLPKYLIPGNHDYDGYYDHLIPLNYKKLFLRDANDKSYFAWRAGKVLFLSLDPNKNFPLSIDEEQSFWADSILTQSLNGEIEWKIILIHQPPYGQGWEGYEGDYFIRNWIYHRAEKFKIDFVLSGHVHDYERLRKLYGKQFTQFIISGGAGGGLEPPESNEIPVMDRLIKRHHFCKLDLSNTHAKLKVFDLHGNVLDSLNIKK